MKEEKRANTMFGPMEPDPTGRKTILLTMAAMILFVTGLHLTLTHGEYFWTALKPSHTVEELMENGAKEGMHVKGEIPYIYECFANRGYMGSDRIEACYYALPSRDGFLIVKVSEEMEAEMEKLLQETVEYMAGGSWPVSKVPIEGIIEKAQGRLPYLLAEYAASINMSQEWIDAMGEPYVIVEKAQALKEAKIWLPVGIILQSGVVLGVVFYVFHSRRRAGE